MRGKKGSLTHYLDGNHPVYSLNDVVYLLSRKDKIDRTEEFLKAVFKQYEYGSPRKSMQQLCAHYKISYHVVSILKKLNIIDDDHHWIYESADNKYPDKRIAIDVQLAYWKHFAKHP